MSRHIRVALATICLLGLATAAAAQGMALLKTALERHEEGDLASAALLYTKAIEFGNLSTANKIIALNNRGSIHIRNERWDLALSDFNRLIELNEDVATAWNNRGACHRAMGNYDDARKDFQRARELAPQNPVVNYNLAREMMREDRYKEAVRAYSIYIKNRPEDPAGYAGRGIARFKMAQVDDAEEDLDKAVELGTRNAEVYKTRAIIRSDAGNYEGAAADFSAAGRLEEGLPAQPTEEELEEGEPAGLNS